MTDEFPHSQAPGAGVDFGATPGRPHRTGPRRRASVRATLFNRVLLAACAALMLCIGPAVMAADGSARHFEIKAEPLSDALMEFGAQSGLTIVAPTTLTAGKQAPAVHGDLTWTEALRQLLQGSGLTFVHGADGAVVIQKAGSGGPVQANSTAEANSPGETGSGAAGQGEYRLADVIVTAQKRSENLLQVAAPVTAVQAADLVRQGATQLADYAASVPGLNLISSQPGQTVIAIRGITTGFGFAIAATTSTYIDDSPFGTSTANAIGSISALDLDPATLQSVEVLRGPQGTLYGANSMGGLIKYVTIPPSLTKSSGLVRLDGNTVDGGGQGYGVSGMWNGPLVADKLGLSIDAYDRHDAGYIDDPFQHRNDVNSSHVAGGRIAALWRPTDQFTAELSALVQNTSTPNTSEVDLNSNLTPIYGKYQHVRYVGEDWILDDALYSFRANYEFGWATLTAITSYQKQRASTHTDFTNRFGGLLSSIIGVPNLGVTDHVHEANHKITQEVRLASPATNRLEWLGGFYFTHEKSLQPENMTGFTLPNALPVPGLGPLFVDPNSDSYKEYAGYGDLTYHLTSKFKVLGGVRYTSDSEDNVTPFSGLFNGPPAIAIANTSSTSVTYSVSPSYDLARHQMVYARVATGFRPGGPTGLTTTSVYAGAPATYDPDKLTNYEVGYKAGFPAERMTVDLSLFDIEWKKIQVLTETNGFYATGNGAAARSNGIEFTWTWMPVGGLNLSANADYTHAYLTADAPGIGGRSGDRLPDVPEFSGNVAASYDFPLSAAASGFVGGNVAYEGARYTDFVSGLPANMTRPIMAGYTQLNLHAGLTYKDLTVEAYARNVNNAYAYSRIYSEAFDGFSAPLAASVIQPRTIGLSASVKF